jgi:ketosteroid isomerase-like protein
LPAVSDAVEANIALARRSYELWNTRGLDAVAEQVWAPDIVFHEIPEAPDAAVFRGAEAVAARARRLIELGGHFQFEVRSLEGRGDYVLSDLEQTSVGATSGVTLTTRVFHVARYVGGRLHELRSYIDADQARHEYERLAVPNG